MDVTWYANGPDGFCYFNTLHDGRFIYTLCISLSIFDQQIVVVVVVVVFDDDDDGDDDDDDDDGNGDGDDDDDDDDDVFGVCVCLLRGCLEAKGMGCLRRK